MADGLIPVYEPQILEEGRFNGDGKSLAEEYETLNEIAVEAGLQPLSEFAEGDVEDWPDDATEPPPRFEPAFHPASEGLSVVEGLLRTIRASPAVASRLADAAYTLEELEELARSLRAAQKSGARFNFAFM